MTTEERIAAIRSLLDRLHTYKHVIEDGSLEPNTIEDMKVQAKELCNQIKAEADAVKAEVDSWA